MNREMRAGEPAKTESNDDTLKVSGYAAVFNSETNIGGYYREQIAPGAFADAASSDDVRFLINHEGLPLARTKSGTLKLTEDDHGLLIEAELDRSDPDVQKIESKMKRGDLDEMSFAFTPEVEKWDDSGDLPLRTLEKVNLFDVAIVTYPAYGDTEIGIRSLENHRKNTKLERSSEVVAAKMRMKLALSQES
jgi:HK97 family phage prohead protease